MSLGTFMLALITERKLSRVKFESVPGRQGVAACDANITVEYVTRYWNKCDMW